MEGVIKKWGNSAAVRIPAGVLADANLALDEPVEVREERGRIVIEPIRQKSFWINALVRGIRPDNLSCARYGYGTTLSGGRSGSAASDRFRTRRHRLALFVSKPTTSKPPASCGDPEPA